MRPVCISPCSVCGLTLEHDHDPRTVLCGGCERDRFPHARIPAHLVPPPDPPTMRQPHKPIKHQVRLTVMAMMGLAFSLGFIAGFLVRGAG